MKVNLFQQSSREARQRSQQAQIRAQRGSADVFNSRGAMGYQRGVKKREQSNRTFIRASSFLGGESMAAPNPRVMTRGGRRRGEMAGYRAPRTRLY